MHCIPFPATAGRSCRCCEGQDGRAYMKWGVTSSGACNVWVSHPLELQDSLAIVAVLAPQSGML
jgi:hypothetical protein